MKTIKFTLFSLIALLVAVLSLKYTVVSLQYITTDFITTDSKELVNFGLTFAIQAIVLAGLSGVALATFIACIQLAIKYYHVDAKVRRDKALLNHIEEERYNELINNLRNTKSIDKKTDVIQDYLDNKRNSLVINATIQATNSSEQYEKARERWENTKEPIKSDLFPKDGIDFIPVDRNIHKE